MSPPGRIEVCQNHGEPLDPNLSHDLSVLFASGELHEPQEEETVVSTMQRHVEINQRQNRMLSA